MIYNIILSNILSINFFYFHSIIQLRKLNHFSFFHIIKNFKCIKMYYYVQLYMINWFNIIL